MDFMVLAIAGLPLVPLLGYISKRYYDEIEISTISIIATLCALAFIVISPIFTGIVVAEKTVAWIGILVGIAYAVFSFISLLLSLAHTERNQVPSSL